MNSDERYMRMHSIKPLFDYTEIYISIGSARRNAGGKDDFQNTVCTHTRYYTAKRIRATIVAPRINMRKRARRKMTANNAWHGYARVN